MVCFPCVSCVLSVYHLRSHIWILSSCVFTLSLRCYRAHGGLNMVSTQHVMNTTISRTHASTNLICWAIPKFLFAYSQGTKVRAQKPSHETKIGHSDCSPWAHGELTVSSRWPKWSQPAVTEPWPGPWLSCDLAVTEPWSYWRCSYWAVTELWLSRNLAVTELWPLLAMTEPWSLGPGTVTTVVTVSSPWAHGDHLFSHGMLARSEIIWVIFLRLRAVHLLRYCLFEMDINYNGGIDMTIPSR